MNNFFQPLNFPNFNFKFPDEDPSVGQKMFFANSKDVLPDDYVSFFNDVFNLKITFLLVFQQKPKTQSNIHLDGLNNNPNVRHTAVNYVITNTNSYMSWYNVLKESKTYIFYPNKTIVTHYEENMVNEACRNNISQFNIVRTDVPHKIVNNGDTTRWCVSVRFDKNYIFEEYKEIFKNYLKV